MVKDEIIVKKYALALFNSIEQSSITSNVFFLPRFVGFVQYFVQFFFH